jgi:hypothetical protein
MAELQARFDVTGWDELELPDLGPGWLGAVRMRKNFTSGIEGSSVALFVSSGEIDGHRAYFAAERITGRVGDGPSGSVTVQHGGLESFPDRWFGHIVPGSGTGSFENWAGSARIEHDEGGAYFVFEH